MYHPDENNYFGDKLEVKIEKVQIVRESLMGGMSCGEPSLVPWKILKKSVNNCISLPDDDIGKAMKLFANASFGNDKIIAGENAAPGVISLIACCNDEKVKNSKILELIRQFKSPLPSNFAFFNALKAVASSLNSMITLSGS